MPQRILRRYAHYDLVDNGQCRIYVNKTGDPITVQARAGRRPEIIRIIDQFGICAAKAEPEDAVCSIGKDADGRWWGWGPASRGRVGVVDGRKLKAHPDV